MLLRYYFNGFLHLLFPRLCMACEANLFVSEEMLCTKCLYHLPFTDFHLDDNNETARQLWGKIEFNHAFSMLHLAKSSPVETLLHKLKYKNQPEIGVFLGKLYAHKITSIPQYVDYIIPVPLHRSKLRKRGYNQAGEFAKGLSLGLNIPLRQNILLREVLSVSQTQKTKTERYDNVKNVFALNIKETLQGKHILLVDDVLTTGATICEAASLLIASGTTVSLATIARA